MQVKDQVIKSIVSGQIFVAPVGSSEGQLLFNEFIKSEHYKVAKQKLIDEAVYLRAQWSTVVPKQKYQSAIKTINQEYSSIEVT